MLDVHELVVRYGRVQALAGVSLTVGRETVAVLGRNGAGKSTLMMALAGLVPVTSGSVSWEGVALNRLRSHELVRRGVSLVPQGRELFAQMTVLENLQLGAPSSGGGPPLEEVFERFPRLAERRGQRAGTMSGGEQQMLAIARALMAGPSLLMLDEPSTGLAPIMVDQVAEVLVGLRAQGLTILLVEQNAHLGLELAERGYVLETGEIVVSGTRAELTADDAIQRAYLGL
jgi:branched-chain amino acid transport system ATP-binding protein